MEMRSVSKAELSRRTGINQQCIGQYVRGNYEARQSVVYVIAKALSVSPAWLAGFDVPMELNNRNREITDKELKRALFGNPDVSDDLLEDIKSVAKMFLKNRNDVPKKKQSRERIS
jgi:repressor LexA